MKFVVINFMHVVGKNLNHLIAYTDVVLPVMSPVNGYRKINTVKHIPVKQLLENVGKYEVSYDSLQQMMRLDNSNFCVTANTIIPVGRDFKKNILDITTNTNQIKIKK